jgi:hypothetical protein
MLLLAVNKLPRAWLGALNDCSLGGAALLILIWAFLLRKEESAEEVVTGHSWDPDALEDLTRQLDSINAALGRFGRN